jgi:uncharacterized repeat protein (TIGR03803 family)
MSRAIQPSEHLSAHVYQESRRHMPATRPCFLLRALVVYGLRNLGVLCLAVSIAPIALHAQTYSDLHDFDCTVEGCSPAYPAQLAQGRDGNLYGTTSAGGTANMGTVFKMTPSGTMITLYSFSGADGETPDAGVVLGTDGNFYGTTNFGGANNMGTVFKITPAGSLTTLHSFATSEGQNPHGGVVQGKNGSFYGTTCNGNPPWTGYSITSSGKFKVLTASIPPCPFGGLVLGSDGNLYGASQVGGTTYQGTVFRMTPAGAVKILYSFDYTHGAYLYSPVVQGNDGLLYGTTSGGGTPQEGVIFKLTTSGKLTLLHQFDSRSGNDGDTPFAGLVAASDGNFYGAALGPNSGLYANGDIFSVSSGGSYSPLYAFDSTHGSLEQATPMQHTNGKIYGVATRGGSAQGGVLYSFDNNLPPFVSLMTISGTAGQTVEILGNGLTGTTGVNFGTASATFNVVSDTYMTATIPANGTSGFVTVTTPSDTLTSNRAFKLTPYVSGISPTSGPVGTPVTITGTGFTGATKVTFGGVKATGYSVSAGTTITVTVPTGAVTGKIAVTTPGGTASSKIAFTVTP